MNESQLFEKLGRLQVAADVAGDAYNKLLGIFASVITGEIELSRCMVNLTDRSWVVAEKGARPLVPATINGIPQVVVAGEDLRAEQLVSAARLVDTLRQEIVTLRRKLAEAHIENNDLLEASTETVVS